MLLLRCASLSMTRHAHACHAVCGARTSGFQPPLNDEEQGHPSDASTPLRFAQHDKARTRLPRRVRCPHFWIPASAGMTRDRATRVMLLLRCASLSMTRHAHACHAACGARTSGFQPPLNDEEQGHPSDASTPLRFAQHDKARTRLPRRVRCPHFWIPASAGMTRDRATRETLRLRCASLSMTAFRQLRRSVGGTGCEVPAFAGTTR